MKEPRIVIVGAGPMALGTAWELAPQDPGARITVLEKEAVTKHPFCYIWAGRGCDWAGLVWFAGLDGAKRAASVEKSRYFGGPRKLVFVHRAFY